MAQYGKRLRSLPPGVEKRLLEHSWPGNVRELQNRILQAVVLCSEERLNAEDLGLAGRGVVLRIEDSGRDALRAELTLGAR